MGKVKTKKSKLGKKAHVVGGLKDYKKTLKHSRVLHEGGYRESDPELAALQLNAYKDKQAAKIMKIANAKPKAKCCRSKTRCWKCPVVIHKLQREISAGNIDRDHLMEVATKARKR